MSRGKVILFFYFGSKDMSKKIENLKTLLIAMSIFLSTIIMFISLGCSFQQYIMYIIFAVSICFIVAYVCFLYFSFRSSDACVRYSALLFGNRYVMVTLLNMLIFNFYGDIYRYGDTECMLSLFFASIDNIDFIVLICAVIEFFIKRKKQAAPKKTRAFSV